MYVRTAIDMPQLRVSLGPNANYFATSPADGTFYIKSSRVRDVIQYCSDSRIRTSCHPLELPFMRALADGIPIDCKADSLLLRDHVVFALLGGDMSARNAHSGQRLRHKVFPIAAWR